MGCAIRRRWVLALTAALGLAAAGPAWANESLEAAVGWSGRRPRNVARDKYRHPLAVLKFFGLRDDQKVLEIEPGGGYWTEILAPYLARRGAYIAALPLPPGREWDLFLKNLAADPAAFGAVRVTAMGEPAAMAPAGSADMILSFRNLHDWMADGTVTAKLAGMFTALKPGGVLGIEDHRGLAATPQDPKAASGYVREDYAKGLIEHAGFRFVAESPVGDNPLDTKDYPAGVWTLPPVLRLGTVDRDKYLAIGESDRWTMKFVKPVA
jgi:predicted methyltransferase